MKANEAEEFLTAVCNALKAEIVALIALGKLAESLKWFNDAAQRAESRERVKRGARRTSGKIV